MSTLDYQNPDEARGEERRRTRMNLFGASKTYVWNALAAELGGRFQKGNWWDGRDRVVAQVGPWQVVLDTFTISTGKSSMTYTRIRAPYVNADGFRFVIYRKNLFSGLGKLLGLQDVEVGHPAFDDAFVIKGNDEAKLRALFANPRLRGLFEAQPNIRLAVRDDEGYFRQTFPAGVDELQFTAVGVITAFERLQLMYELFAETLHTLCHIGSAYEDDPGIVLDR